MLAAIIVLAVLALGAAAVAARLWIERDPLRPKVSVMVMTRNGHGVRGILVKRSRTWLELSETLVITQGSNPANAAPGGIMHIDRTEVQWVQVLNG